MGNWVFSGNAHARQKVVTTVGRRRRCAHAHRISKTTGEQHVLVRSLPGEIAELMFFDKEEDADDAEAMEPIPKSGLQCHCLCV